MEMLLVGLVLFGVSMLFSNESEAGFMLAFIALCLIIMGGFRVWNEGF